MVEQTTRTNLYLYPALYCSYNAIFRNAFESWKHAKLIRGKYIGDVNGTTQNCIYVLVKRMQGMGEYIKFFSELKALETYYEVPPDHIMFVLRVPEEHHKAYANFMLFRYSKMYSQDWLKKHFNNNGTFPNNYHVLARTEEGRQKVIRDFNLDRHFDAEEYDGEWLMENEYFLATSMSPVPA